MSARITFAVAARVLVQLRRDHRTLAMLLVLDEPTVGLDPVLRRDLWAMFHELAAAGACVMVSSHVMDEAERCDRLLLMRDGTLLAADTPRDLLERTHTPDVEAAFLDIVDRAREAA